MKKIFLVLLSVAFLSSCTHSYGPRKLQGETLESISQKIILGKSDKANILKEFGNPISRKMTAKGDETWSYLSSSTTVAPFYGSTKNKILSVTFDKSGIVSDFAIDDSKL